jgi:hypothetical protein
MWQGIDSQIIGTVAASAGKYVFTRARPSADDNPCLWFQGGSSYSFPSGEAAFSAALVTPYIIEYGSDHPVTYALLLLPLYVGAGRIKNQAHWQTDVIAVRTQPQSADHDRTAPAWLRDRLQNAVLGSLNDAGSSCRIRSLRTSNARASIIDAVYGSRYPI